MSCVSTLIERYRAATDHPDSVGRAEDLVEKLTAIGQTEPVNAAEADLKVQLLSEDGVGGKLDTETYQQLVMKAYIERLLFSF